MGKWANPAPNLRKYPLEKEYRDINKKMGQDLPICPFSLN
jgi:hypothetical protein